MSISLIKEEVNDEDVEEINQVSPPVVWQRLATGFRIEDLKENHYNEVIEMLKEHYIPNEVLCENTRLKDDEVSVESYINRIMFHLKDQTSIIAIDESYKEDVDEDEKEPINKKIKKEDEKIKIIAVLIMRIAQKLDYGRVFSGVLIVQGDAMEQCVKLRSHISKKVDIYATYNCESFLRYYDLCILPEYRKQGLGMHMLRCGVDLARSMNVPVVMGLFPNLALQKLAKKLQMETLFEVKYAEWRDSGGAIIFDNPGTGNCSCALMAGLVPPPPKLEIPKPKVEPTAGGKKGKKDKNDKKGKKK